MKPFITILTFSLLCGEFLNAQTYIQVSSVKTPNNNTVQDTWQLTSNDIVYSPAQIATLAADLYSNYNGAEIVEAPSYKYNCHAYAWHVSEGGNKVWIGRYTDDAEDIYWTDNSYIEVPENIATKVSYHKDGNHSAIRLNSNLYESKWGWAGPLVRHGPNDVLSIYQPAKAKKYYIRTPSISGSSTVCSSGSSFSISDLPTGATITWSCGPLVTRQSAQGSNPCTFKSTGVGESYIQAVVSYQGNTFALPRLPVLSGTCMSGVSPLCSSGGQFSISNVPSGATITWQPGFGIQRVSPQGSNPCAFKAVSSGTSSSISAVISYAGVDYTAKFDIWVGSPHEPNILTSPNVTVVEENAYFTVPQGAQNVYFQMENDYSKGYPITSLDDWDWYGVNAMFKVWNFLDMGTDYYGVNYVTGYQYNSCPTPVEFNFIVEVVGNRSGDAGGGPELTLSPNPAGEYVDIRIDFGDEEREPPNYVMEILNTGSYPVRNAVLSGGYNRVSVQGLQRGYYVVRIRYGDTVLTKPLMVE